MKVPFDYTAISWRAFRRCGFAVIEFFLMGNGQCMKAAAETEEAAASDGFRQLFSAEYDADAVGDSYNCSSLFSVCSWNPSTSDSWNSNQTGESSERKIRR